MQTYKHVYSIKQAFRSILFQVGFLLATIFLFTWVEYQVAQKIKEARENKSISLQLAQELRISRVSLAFT